MVQNKTMKSTEFNVLQNFVIVAPVALETGEVIECGIITDTEQNNSIINRPTTGTVVSIGPDVESVKVNSTILWVEQDGIDMEFEDGEFLILRETSILGYKD
jgi:co-chaperonin GroES (HSP10)